MRAKLLKVRVLGGLWTAYLLMATLGSVATLWLNVYTARPSPPATAAARCMHTGRQKSVRYTTVSAANWLGAAPAWRGNASDGGRCVPTRGSTAGFCKLMALRADMRRCDDNCSWESVSSCNRVAISPLNPSRCGESCCKDVKLSSMLWSPATKQIQPVIAARGTPAILANCRIIYLETKSPSQSTASYIVLCVSADVHQKLSLHRQHVKHGFDSVSVVPGALGCPNKRRGRSMPDMQVFGGQSYSKCYPRCGVLRLDPQAPQRSCLSDPPANAVVRCIYVE